MNSGSGAYLNDHKVQLQVRTWENVLKSLVKQVRYPQIREKKLTTGVEIAYDFIVARRWNSFYPTFFDVFGGGYIIRCMSRTNESLIVIDPGFNFFSILRSLALDPRRIKAVILTHNHPDHTGNLDEFFTLMAQLDARAHLYMNQTCYEACKLVFSTSVSRPYVLKPGERLHIIDVNEKKGGKEKTLGTVHLETTRAHHWEIGGFHEALGLKLELASCVDNKDSKMKIGITGDTDSSIQYMEDYVKTFKDVDILVVHVGAWYDKRIKGDKHLYSSGTKKLLTQLHGEKKRKTMVIILSEFGLEMANLRLLGRTLKPFTHIQKLPSVGKIATRRSRKRENNILDLLRSSYNQRITDGQLVELVQYGILYPEETKEALVQFVDADLGLLGVVENKIQEAKILKFQRNIRDQIARKLGRDFAQKKGLSRLGYLSILTELTNLLYDLRHYAMQIIRARVLNVKKIAEQVFALTAREAFFNEVFKELIDPRIEAAKYLSKMLSNDWYVFPADVGSAFRIIPSQQPIDHIKILARKDDVLDYFAVKKPHQFDFVLQEDSMDPLLFGRIQYILRK